MNSDFIDLLSLLNRFGVRYLIVGGYAVMFHTEPRFTKDLDVFVGVSESDLKGLAAALAEFGFPLSDENLAQLRLPNRMIALGRAPVRIDILNEITGVEFSSAWERRIDAAIGDVTASFLSLHDLISAKRASGRPQDLIDLANLEAAQRRLEPT